MADRQYSVDEIMRMRAAVHRMAKYSPIPGSAAATEDQVRTYIQNGTDPSDLESAADSLDGK